MANKTRPSTEQKILAFIQARMTSTRLPGKVLADICGEPMLVRVVERTKRSKYISKVVVVTSDDPSDDPVLALCQIRDYPCFRGNLHDVLDRYYQASRSYQADVIVRITGDCPVIDPDVIDAIVKIYLDEQTQYSRNDRHEWDLVTNRLPPPWHRTYPIGLDTEVCSMQALQRAWKEATQAYQREHVMPFLYDPARSVVFSSLKKEQPKQKIPVGYFKVLVIDHEPDFGSYRLTVDTFEDLELVRQIYLNFNGHDTFDWLSVIQLLQQKPELLQINAQIKPKSLSKVDSMRLP